VLRRPLPEAAVAKIAVVSSMTGAAIYYGVPVLDGVRLAVDEANGAGQAPRIEIMVHDDLSTDDGARDAAGAAVESDALVVVGPVQTTSSIAAGLTLAEGGLVSIVPTAHGDAVTSNETTFRAVISTSEMGEALANYLYYVLNGKRAAMTYPNNGYGRPVAKGFRRAAERLGIETSYYAFNRNEEREEAARRIAAEPDAPAVVLGMIGVDAVPMLTALRRLNVPGPRLGTDAIALESLHTRFANEPEYQRDPGYFTDSVYAVSPMIIDSANAETLAFADRFRARFGRQPGWVELQAYEGTRLAIAAVRATSRAPAGANLAARRKAIADYLMLLDGPAHALSGPSGPLWFTPDRGRQQTVRMGRFHGTIFESAPLQLVRVPNPNGDDIASGAVVDVGNGHYARRQQVVYTCIYLNEIPRIDIAQSRFTADFYLWVRYASGAGKGAADPADIDFPDLVRGTSDGKLPAASGRLDDGTNYQLRRMRGDFKNDFDLHRYPADLQTLAIRLFNARAATDRIVYVQDRRSAGNGAVPVPGAAQAGDAKVAASDPPPADVFGGAVADGAFRNLTQWEPLWAREGRADLVTASALGDPRLVGAEQIRELSGFDLTFQVRRLVFATLAKTLLPLGLMALIMLASLYFPNALVKEKITVAITGALSGAVLLAAINAQLGGIGYIIAVEYGFYVFFILCLLCIVSVLVAEQFRVAKRPVAATLVERSARALYILALVATAVAAWYAVQKA
jgi:branched-chain amino acid transport system substrate-binding protein